MKNILISGAGEVGRYTAEVLQERGHSITVIDSDLEALKRLENSIEARLIHGSSCYAEVLSEAHIADVDILIAATSLDEINFLTAAIGKQMGARHVVARVHQRAFVKCQQVNYSQIFNIDSLICPEELTSRAILAKLHDPGVAAVQRFAGDHIELHQYTIRPQASAFHKPLKDLMMPPGVRVITVRRGKKSIIPDGDTVLTRNDVVTIVVPIHSLKEVNNLFDSDGVRNQDVAIAGASDVSEWLLSEVDHERFHMRLFENDLATAERIASQFPKVTVLNADTVDAHIFSSEHLEDVGAFIASGHNEEHNIMAALQAKNKGVQSTFAIIHNSSYLSSLEGIGIDYPFSPRIEAAKEVLRLIDDSPIRILSTIEGGKIVVYELKVGTTAKNAGMSLDEMNFPRTTIIAAIQRGDRVIAPVPKDTVESGDTIVVIGPERMEKTLKKLFI